MKQRLSYLVTAVIIVVSLSQYASAQDSSPFWSLGGNSNASSTTSKLGTTNAVNLGLFTNNIERLRIVSTNGNVGIGTLTPTERLRINGPAGISPLRVQVNGASKFYIDKNGGVAIGASVIPPASGLYVAGKVGLGVKEPTARLDIAGTDGDVTLLNLTNGNIRVNSDWSDDSQSIGISSSDFIGVKGSGWYGIWGTGIVGVVGDGGDGGYGGVFKVANSGYPALSVDGGSSIYAVEINGKVWSSGGYVTSDRNLKQDVTEFGDALAIIEKLKPLNYQFKKDPKYAFLHLPEGAHYGLLAQDVENILPNLVSTANHQALDLAKPGSTSNSTTIVQKQKAELISIKAVNYVELIPIMIKAMQEQQAEDSSLKAQLADQQEQITELRKMLMDLKNEKTSTLNSTGASLEQNTPNPVRNSTLIRFQIPATISNAYLTLTDAKGQMIRTLIITNRGTAQLNLDASMLAAGTYNYALYVDGRQAGTKQLIVTR